MKQRKINILLVFALCANTLGAIYTKSAAYYLTDLLCIGFNLGIFFVFNVLYYPTLKNLYRTTDLLEDTVTTLTEVKNDYFRAERARAHLTQELEKYKNKFGDLEA